MTAEKKKKNFHEHDHLCENYNLFPFLQDFQLVDEEVFNLLTAECILNLFFQTSGGLHYGNRTEQHEEGWTMRLIAAEIYWLPKAHTIWMFTSVTQLQTPSLDETKLTMSLGLFFTLSRPAQIKELKENATVHFIWNTHIGYDKDLQNP